MSGLATSVGIRARSAGGYATKRKSVCIRVILPFQSNEMGKLSQLNISGVQVAIVITPGGRDLNELLVCSGLARIYGTRTPLPDSRDSREYLAHLHALENEAKAANRGGWAMVQT